MLFYIVRLHPNREEMKRALGYRGSELFLSFAMHFPWHTVYALCERQIKEPFDGTMKAPSIIVIIFQYKRQYK